MTTDAHYLGNLIATALLTTFPKGSIENHSTSEQYDVVLGSPFTDISTRVLPHVDSFFAQRGMEAISQMQGPLGFTKSYRSGRAGIPITVSATLLAEGMRLTVGRPF